MSSTRTRVEIASEWDTRNSRGQLMSLLAFVTAPDGTRVMVRYQRAPDRWDCETCGRRHAEPGCHHTRALGQALQQLGHMNPNSKEGRP